MCSVHHDKLTLRHNATTHILYTQHNATTMGELIVSKYTYKELKQMKKQQIQRHHKKYAVDLDKEGDFE